MKLFLWFFSHTIDQFRGKNGRQYIHTTCFYLKYSCCGRKRDDHPAAVSKEDSRTWNTTDHTRELPTDAFGEMEFARTAGVRSTARVLLNS